jgi:hypothetical protein
MISMNVNPYAVFLLFSILHDLVLGVDMLPNDDVSILFPRSNSG